MGGWAGDENGRGSRAPDAWHGSVKHRRRDRFEVVLLRNVRGAGRLRRQVPRPLSLEGKMHVPTDLFNAESTSACGVGVCLSEHVDSLLAHNTSTKMAQRAD